MSFRRSNLEAQFADAVQADMVGLAHSLDPYYDTGIPHALQERKVTISAQAGCVEYLFGGVHDERVGSIVDPLSGERVGWTELVPKLWLREKSQQNLSPDDFEQRCGSRIADPYVLITYGQYAIVSTLDYTAWPGFDDLERSAETTLWGFRDGATEAERVEVKRAATASNVQRLLQRRHRKPRMSHFDGVLEGYRVGTIFTRLGWSATRLADLVSGWADELPDLEKSQTLFTTQ